MQKSDIVVLLELKRTYKMQYGTCCSPTLVSKEYRLPRYKKFLLAMFKHSYYQKYGMDVNYIYQPKDVVTLCGRSHHNDRDVARDVPMLIYDNLCKKYDPSLSVVLIHQLAGVASGELTVGEYVNKMTAFMRDTVAYGYNGFNMPIDSERQWEATQCLIKSVDYVLTDTTWKWRTPSSAY